MTDPVVQSYLIRFREGLSRLPANEQEELVKEITNHIAEAVEAGQPVAAVLAGLGPAERLARAYLADAFLSDDEASPSVGPVVRRPSRLVSQFGLLLAMGLPTFIITLTLGATAFGLGVGGIATIIGGIVAFSMPGLVSLPFAAVYGTGQAIAITVGLFLVLAAWGCYRLLRWYLRVVAGMFSQAKVS